MKPRDTRFAAALFAALLLLAACGSDSQSTTAQTTTSEEATAQTEEQVAEDEPTNDAMADEAPVEEDNMSDDAAVDEEDMSDEAAAEDDTSDEVADTAGEADAAGDMAILAAGELRATLTSHLQEHVYLSGITVETIEDAAGDLDDPAVVGALAALDENSLAIAGLIGAAAPAEQEPFLALWREHVGFFMDYAQGAVTGDADAQAAALANLDGYRDASGAFFERVTGGTLPADAVSDNFAMHVNTLIAAFDSLATGEADAFENLHVAAEHMKISALALASGFSAALPDAFPGDVADAEAETRAAITYALGEHVFLSGIAFGQLAEADGDASGPAAVAAFDVLDTNSVDIAAIIGSLVPDEEEGFLALWREHLGFFTDYANGAIDADADAQAVALANLDGYRSASGAFFDRLTGGALPAAAVEENFAGHVNTLNGAIDALAADDPDAWLSLRMAARHMPGTAAERPRTQRKDDHVTTHKDLRRLYGSHSPRSWSRLDVVRADPRRRPGCSNLRLSDRGREPRPRRLDDDQRSCCRR